jgi:hypothetical protein
MKKMKDYLTKHVLIRDSEKIIPDSGLNPESGSPTLKEIKSFENKLPVFIQKFVYVLNYYKRQLSYVCLSERVWGLSRMYKNIT